MEKRNIVGERVRQARKNAKPTITQLDLVARLQVLGMKIDQSGLSKIEGGNRPVFDYEVMTLAKALKVEVGWLLGESKVPSTPVDSKRSPHSELSKVKSTLALRLEARNLVV